jgi:hypothetical protein
LIVSINSPIRRGVYDMVGKDTFWLDKGRPGRHFSSDRGSVIFCRGARQFDRGVQTRTEPKGRNVMTGPYSVRPWRSRREFLKSSVAVAAGAYGLSPSFAVAAPVPEKFDGSAFKLKAPEPNAKSGGVLRHAERGPRTVVRDVEPSPSQQFLDVAIAQCATGRSPPNHQPEEGRCHRAP